MTQREITASVSLLGRLKIDKKYCEMLDGGVYLVL